MVVIAVDWSRWLPQRRNNSGRCPEEPSDSISIRKIRSNNSSSIGEVQQQAPFMVIILPTDGGSKARVGGWMDGR